MYQVPPNNIIVNTSFGDGTTWKRIADLTETEFDGYASGMFSNNAYLPLARITQEKAKVYCSKRVTTIDGVNHSARLGSRQEYIVFGAWHDDLAPKDVVKIESRLKVNGENDITNHSCLTQNAYTTGQYRGLDFDPAPYSTNSFDVNDLSSNSYPSVSLTDWTPDNRGWQQYERPATYKTGSYSSDATHSSHLCVSKFGVQDIVGNDEEMTIEVINKTGVHAVGYEFEMKINELPSDVASYWLNTATATPGPFGPLLSDYYGYNWSGPLSNMQVLSSNNDKYFNPLTGLYFTCDNTTWGLGSDCWEKTQDAADALVGRPDSDNYKYSNSTKDYLYGWTAPANDLDLKPGVLSLVGDQEEYKPFMYSYRNFNQTFANNYWYVGDYTLTVGNLGIYNRSSSLNDSSLYSIHGTRKSDVNSNSSSFRCVVPIN